MLDSARVKWDDGRRLWSLLDMIDYVAIYLCDAFQQLEVWMFNLQEHPDQRAELHADFKRMISQSSALRSLQEHKEILVDLDLEFKIARLRNELDHRDPFTAESLRRELRGIRDQARIALAKRKFASIPEANEIFFEQEKLFGDAVFDKFKDCRDEIKDSGNAIAADLYSAAVFHLVRVSEHGLRSLAKRLRATIKDKNKTVPLEYGDWNKVITACRGQITRARALPSNAAREKKLQMYSRAADLCEYLKDLWRNEASHARKRYRRQEALDAFDQVKAFMALLAEQVL